MDQTSFTSTQEVLQAPPQEPKPITDEQLPPAPKKKKFIIAVILTTVTVLLLLLLLVTSQTKKPSTLPTVEFPDNSYQPTSPFATRLNELSDQIQNSDPTSTNLALPPIDYNVQMDLNQ